MFPGFRIMAVSMEGLQIGIARILSIATDVIHLQVVLLLEEQPTIGAAPALPLQPRTAPVAMSAPARTLRVPRCMGESLPEARHSNRHPAAREVNTS